MPKAAEERLKAIARNKKLKGKSLNAYVFGSLRKMGWKPKRER